MELLSQEIREARLLLAWAGATVNAAARIAARHDSETAVLAVGRDELAACGLQNRQIDEVLAARSSGEHLRHEDDLRRRSAETIVFGEPAYPPRLRDIASPPAALFVKGRLPDAEQASVAIIGSRRCTPEGVRLAEELAADLAANGAAVVSGLARGIDSAALSGCLRGGSRAVGVLGSGLDFVYPPENLPLFERIACEGALVSEYRLGIRPRRELFPRRNRLIAGLADGVLVVQASDRSGTLITVDHAIDQDRIVMAVPGPVGHPAYKGTNRLVRDGAQVILGAEDVALSLGIPYRARGAEERGGRYEHLPPVDAAVLRLCRRQAMTPDAIATGAGLAVSAVLEALARLEAEGCVERFPGARFLAARDRERR